MGAGRVTRQDVAEFAGVSTAVVSYVLNNGPRPVAAKTRQRVEEAMAHLGYRPNASARALKLARADAIGLLVPNISNPFFSEFAQHVQDFASVRGTAVMVGNTDLDPEREAAQLRSILDREIDGLIVFGIRDERARAELVRSGVPIVSMDWQFQSADIPTVVADDYGAALAGISHLIDHGYESIGFIGGPDDLEVSHARRRAWEDATARLERNEAFVASADYTRAGGYRAAQAVLGSQERPRALFVSSDIQAIGALHFCHDAGFRVPADVAIASFDGTQDSQYSNPSLTAVQLPLRLMAQQAVRTLLDPDRDENGLHHTVPHTLVIRESCGRHTAD